MKTSVTDYKDDSTSTPAFLQTDMICCISLIPSCLFVRKVVTVIKAPVLLLRKTVDHHNCVSVQRVDASLN